MYKVNKETLISNYILKASNHEWKVVVSDPISDIDWSKDWCVDSMECIETGPEVISDVSNSLSAVLGQTPAVLGEVRWNII